MENNLPVGWLDVQLATLLVSLESGSRPKGGVRGIAQGVPSIGGEHLNDEGGFKFSNIKFVPINFASTMNRGQIHPNDVLIVKDGATTGKTAFVNNSFPFTLAFVNEHVFICRPSTAIDPKYLFYFLWSRDGQQRILNNFKGSAQGGINTGFELNTIIPLAPFPEQKRIVIKLNSLFDKIETNKKRIERIPQILKRFRKSVLADAVSGRLTEDWRKENNSIESAEVSLKKLIQKRIIDYDLRIKSAKKDKLPKPPKPNFFEYTFEHDTSKEDELPSKWIVSKVGLLCDCIVPGRDKPKSFTGKIPWITLPEIDGDILYKDSGRYKLSECEIREVNARIIPIDSVIMCCVGRFGISAIVKDPLVINQQLHAFIKSEIISPEFLMYHLRTLEDYQNSIATSTTIAYLNKTNCNSLPINLPPLEEQIEIVRTVKQLFSFANKIESRYLKAKAQLDKLPQSILAKAFRGELVPQDPEDEPANLLLERILTAKRMKK